MDNSSVFLLDFGISKWIDGIHRKTNSFHGSLVWAGYYNTVGIEYAPRDDLLSLGYSLVYFLKKRLPWARLVANNSTYARSLQFRVAVAWMKASVDLEQLCSGLPGEFVDYFRYVHALGYNERVDYVYLYQLFNRAIEFH